MRFSAGERGEETPDSRASREEQERPSEGAPPDTIFCVRPGVYLTVSKALKYTRTEQTIFATNTR